MLEPLYSILNTLLTKTTDHFGILFTLIIDIHLKPFTQFTIYYKYAVFMDTHLENVQSNHRLTIMWMIYFRLLLTQSFLLFALQ